ncbi:SRPBCC family protein [Peijinzhouia sedimentorum]
MKALKIILIGLASIIALVLVAAIFVDGNYAVEREVTINRSKSEVFDYIKYLRNQDEFSKWASMDPNMKKDFRGTDGAVGFVSAWESESDDVGKGEQEIIAIVEGERIDYELRFLEPVESTSQAYMITESAGMNQTTVKWGINGKMTYPMNLMLLFMDMEEMLGADLSDGLNNLKVKLESN